MELTENLLQLKPDAVILAPIFRNESLSFTIDLQKNNIPFSFIDSLIEEAAFTTYYGQNSFQSGYVAAKLLLNDLPDNSHVLVLRTKRQGAISNQTKLLDEVDFTFNGLCMVGGPRAASTSGTHRGAERRARQLEVIS